MARRGEFKASTTSAPVAPLPMARLMSLVDDDTDMVVVMPSGERRRVVKLNLNVAANALEVIVAPTGR